MITCCIITMSDSGARGERDDASGPEAARMLSSAGIEVRHQEIIPDEFDIIRDTLIRYAARVDLIVTTGGTGLTPRDVTPEATAAVIEREVPGIAEAMRAEGMKKTPRAMLSRALAGTRGACLIVNLPGSPKAVRENLGVLIDILPHAVEKLKGSASECAR